MGSVTGIAVVLRIHLQVCTEETLLWIFQSVNTLRCFEVQKLVGHLNKHYIVVSFIHGS